jgi:ubiquitin-protein ligase E3 C
MFSFSFEEQQISSSGSHVMSKRQLAYMSPRLGILNNIPFAIPFEIRVSIFRHFVLNDMSLHAEAPVMYYHGNNKTKVQVRRGNVAQDGFDKLAEVNLKTPMEITFIDEFGEEE